MTGNHSSRSLAVYAPAVVLTALSAYLFTGEVFTRFGDTNAFVWGTRQIAGSVCLVLAMVAAGVAFGAWDNYDFPATSKQRGIAPAKRHLLSFLPAMASYGVATVLYLTTGETGWVRLFWTLSVVLLVAPIWRDFKGSDFWPLASWEYLLVLLICAIGFGLRYAELTEVPFHVDNDVSIMGLFSRHLIETNDWRWVGMAPTDHHFSEHQYIALSMRLFGNDHYGLSMLSVLTGSATCGLLFYVGRIFFNRWVGLIAAAFLAFNYVHIHFSRIIFGPISTFFVVLAGLFLLHGLRSARALSFAVGGMSLGAGLLGYYSARIGPVLFVGLFVGWWLQRRRFPEVKLSHWLIALCGILAVFGPNLAFGLTHFSEFSGRGNEVILWTDNAWNHLSAKYESHGSAFVVIKEQIKRTLLAPFYFPDESTICHLRKPMLGALTAFGFVAGLGFCFRRLLNLYCYFPLLWVGVTLVFGGILTIDPPFWPHLNIAVPGMVLIAAIGIERLASRLVAQRGAMTAWLVPAGVSAAILFSGVHNWEVYYRFARDHGTGRIHAMRQLRNLAPDCRVYLVSHDVRWRQETFQFFTPTVDGQDLDPQALLTQVPVIDRPTVFLVFGDVDAACLTTLIKAFPHAQREAFWDGWGWPVFTRVDVNPPDYVYAPQNSRKPAEFLWSTWGWRFLAVGAVVVVVLGTVLILRQIRPAQTSLPERS